MQHSIARVVLYSVVSVTLDVCLSVCLSNNTNTITPELLEISSLNFQGIVLMVLWSKGQTSSKAAINVCAAADLTFLMFC